jgi:hypothetical protein|tara:strand:+ start:6923 stop:8323 length:1401 start_codon:yes stop_codon:yes gene_type:complete
MGAMDKVLNMMMPDLQNNQMANLLGIDNVKKARGRGLLDAGLSMMALSGPRPASENINPAMIMKAGVDAGTQTYDTAINKQLNNHKTNLALKAQADKKNSFTNLMDSDLFTTDEKEYAKMLGAVDGGDFLSKVYMEKLKKIDAKPSVKEMVIINETTGKPQLRDDGKILRQYVDIKDIMEAPHKYQIPDETGTFAKNISDIETTLKRPLTLEEKTKFVEAKMNGDGITFTTNADGSTTLQIGGSGSDSNNMEPKSKASLETMIINNSLNFESFKDIASKYRKEFSTLPIKTKVWYKKIQEGLGDWSPFGDISDDDKQLIKDYTAWEQASYEAVNKYIKSITGAQMSEREADRIMKGFANVKDLSPTAYETKLNGILENALFSTIRSNLILRKGLNIPVDQYESIMHLGSVRKVLEKIQTEMKTELMEDENWKYKSDQEINTYIKQEMKILMYGDNSQNQFTLENLQ